MEQPGAASKAQPTDRNGLDSRRGTIRWHVVVLLAAGGALRIWPVFVLGHRFSGLVAIQPHHKLVRAASTAPSVTRAIWRCSSTRWDGRSPFVRGSGYCSQCSIFRRSSRIRAEERMLRTEFGGEYDVYCSRTSQLIPGLY